MTNKPTENATEISDQDTFELPEAVQRQPFETHAEYRKFLHFLHQPIGRRSVRTAYKTYCDENGIKAKNQPPSSWYQLYNGQYLALRRLLVLAEKIEAAQLERGEIDFNRLHAVMLKNGDLTGDDWADYKTLTKYACWSLGLDDKGDPIPDCPSWPQLEAASDDQARAELLARYEAVASEHKFYHR